MRNAALLAILLTSACKKGDDCQQFWDKTAPLMAKAAPGGKPMPADAQDKFLKECRGGDKMKKDPVFKCVLDASGDSAISACMSKAFGDYMGKSKKTEAQLMLNRLSKNAKVAFMTESSFPVGKAGPTPAQPCCEQPNRKCAPVPADQWAADPVWSKLEFSIDEATMFQYSYESDGKTATATAVGDLDCDGTPATYKLELTAGADGNVQANIVEPPAGTY